MFTYKRNAKLTHFDFNDFSLSGEHDFGKTFSCSDEKNRRQQKQRLKVH